MDGFDTINKIFDPVVEEGGIHETETGTERQYPTNGGGSEETTKTVDAEKVAAIEEDDADIQNDDVKYDAQRPYPQTSSTEEEYTRHSSSSSRNPSRDGGHESHVTTRRVVVTGSDDEEAQTTVEVLGTNDNNQYRPAQTRTDTYRNQRQSSNPYNTYPTRRTQSQPSRTYTSRSQTDRRTVGRAQPRTREEIRGQRYDGPIYRDNHGHNIDAQGRHLDSTGRYYDVSGRYTDASVTHSVTYSGPNSGGRHTGGSSSSGRQTSGSSYGDRQTSGSSYRGRPTGVSSSGDRLTGGRQTGDRQTGGRQTGNRQTGGRQTGGSSSGGRYYDAPDRSQSGYYDNSRQQVTGGSSGRVPNQYVDSQSRPVDSYGGTQFYSGGSNYQTTYNPSTSQISSSSVR